MRIVAIVLVVMPLGGLRLAAQQQPQSGTRRSHRSRSSSPARAPQFRDDPGRRARWFLRGRVSESIRTFSFEPKAVPAAHLLRSIQAREQMVSSPTFHSLTTLGVTGVAEVPRWTELGPRGQIGSRWGTVSGRV